MYYKRNQEPGARSQRDAVEECTMFVEGEVFVLDRSD